VDKLGQAPDSLAEVLVRARQADPHCVPGDLAERTPRRHGHAALRQELECEIPGLEPARSLRHAYALESSLVWPLHICSPLATKSGYLGLAYLDARIPEGETKPKFKSADLRFASALSIFAATRLSQLRRLSSGSWGGSKSLAELKDKRSPQSCWLNSSGLRESPALTSCRSRITVRRRI